LRPQSLSLVEAVGREPTWFMQLPMPPEYMSTEPSTLTQINRVSRYAMSALGQKQTLLNVQTASALPPKADMRIDGQDVCLGPIAGIALDHSMISSARAKKPGGTSTSSSLVDPPLATNLSAIAIRLWSAIPT
jgi:hypothetical protein